MELMGHYFVGIVYQASMRVAQFTSCHWFHVIVMIDIWWLVKKHSNVPAK